MSRYSRPEGARETVCAEYAPMQKKSNVILTLTAVSNFRDRYVSDSFGDTINTGRN
jgi:hypothetical protein